MKWKTFLCPLFILFSLNIMANPLPEEGKTIFMTRCAACHNVNKQLTGPALAGVDGRHSIEWIIKFVHSSQTVIKSGDKEAIALFEKFNRIQMPDHPDLTGENIQQIVEFIKSESKLNAGLSEAPFSKPTSLKPNFLPLSIANYGFFLTFFFLLILLVLAMLVLVKVKEYEREMRTESSGKL